MTRSLLAVLALAGAALVAGAQPRSDSTRRVRTLDQELYFRPSPEGVKAAASGFEEPLADLVWVRSVLMFGEHFDGRKGGAWTAWLAGSIDVVTHLDPRWRTPYLYGGGMLRSLGEVEAASGVYERCATELPEDYWCPFARGMNDLLYADDAAAAAEWLREAARRPGAPDWYGSAAAAMQSRAGQRRAGIAYLEEQLATTEDPRVRTSLEDQLGRLRHNEIVATWEAECVARRESGRRLQRPEELPPPGKRLPDNPRGDAWIVGADGVVRSEAAERERVRKARQDEWALIRR
jgi:hypothetical protein